MAPILRREAALFREFKTSWINGKSLLFEQLQHVPALRLRSRNPIWIDDPGPTNTVYDLLARWREMWSLSAPVHSDLVRNPTVEPPMHRYIKKNKPMAQQSLRGVSQFVD
jgi:hypothetical protein